MAFRNDPKLQPALRSGVVLLAVLATALAATSPVRAQDPILVAYSREVVVINSEVVPEFTQAYSRQAVLVSSEASPVLTQAYSKEAVLVVSESPIVDTFSREIAVYDGYYTPEAFDALRIAGGLQKATADNVTRFALALQLTNATRINLPVAVRILRIATRLQP